jgi:RNA 3'-terminal phosphate cyclase (ATP)
MLSINGSHGEGGGQILRTALSLACITQTPIELTHIRASRAKPGLRPQHLACVKAAAELCGAEVLGGELGSQTLRFVPHHPVRAGVYQWDIGTAGSATLLAQTVLLPLALANGPSQVRIIGGTHVPASPPAHFLRDVYTPMLVQSGADVVVSLERYGWHPRGGGEIRLYIEGWAQLEGQDLRERGGLERVFGESIASHLPAHIPQRMTAHGEKLLQFDEFQVDLRPTRDGSALSKGAGFFITAEYGNGRAGFSCLGEEGFPAEKVAEEAINDLFSFHARHASVDSHLADQLLLVLMLAQGPSHFVTDRISEHFRTNVWVIQRFIERDIQFDVHTGHVDIAG